MTTRWLVCAVLLVLAGCSDPLTPAQQAEYDRLKERRQQAAAAMAEANQRRQRAFATATRLERSKGAKTSRALVCGSGRDAKQRFGKVTVRKKSFKPVLSRTGSRRVAGGGCTEYQLKRVK